MGARGPLKLVPHLASVDPSGTAAAEVSVGAPVKPDAIAGDPVLSGLWDQVVPALLEAGMVSQVDGPALEMAFRHFRAARAASDELERGSATVWDEKNGREMKNPAEVVFRSESLAFLEYAKQLGLTFGARARTPMGGGAEDDGNPFAPAQGAGV